MKYKRGQKVKIKDNLKITSEWGSDCIRDYHNMESPRIVTVKLVHKSTNRYEFEEIGFAWEEYEIEPINPNDQVNSRFELLDI